MPRAVSLIALVGSLLTHSVLVGPVAAQDNAILADLPLNKISKSPQVIRAQIQLGLTFQRQALDALRRLTSPEEAGTVRPRILQGYYELRFAMHGLTERKNASRFGPDPIASLALEYGEKAMAEVRRADTELQSGEARRLPGAVERLQAAIGHAEQAGRLF